MSLNPRFISVVPARRTLPGLDVFEYAVAGDADIQPGDIIIIPFRTQKLPALVVTLQNQPTFNGKIRSIETIQLLFRCGAPLVTYLRESAAQTFCSQPTVLTSWLRTVPKRSLKDGLAPLHLHINRDGEDGNLREKPGERQTSYLSNRWFAPNGILHNVRAHTGRRLIITPWKHTAEKRAADIDCPFLHSDLADGAAWETLLHFLQTEDTILYTTRIGAWLSLFADTVFLDEPENDDHKQDELSPRLDARWLVKLSASLRPKQNVYAFSTTPRLVVQREANLPCPDITLNLHLEPWIWRGASPIDNLSEQTLQTIASAKEEHRSIFILHPVRGERARVRCRDCGWTATCTRCAFEISLEKQQGICRRCHLRQALPETCPTCGGSELNRGRGGIDRLISQWQKQFGTDPAVKLLTLDQFFDFDIPENSLVVLTDVSLIGGYAEDIRRKERFVIAWRRLADLVSCSKSEFIVQGPEELLDQAPNWLTRDGVNRTWEQELSERQRFGYPPSRQLVKIISKGKETKANELKKRLEHLIKTSKLPITSDGPYRVANLPKERQERWILHLHPDPAISQKNLRNLLTPLRGEAIIDLDPTAFFS